MDLRLKFNEDVFNYDKFRPTYADEIFSDIINYTGLCSSHKALEIGIATGQATLPILKTGCNVKAIELGNNLAEYFKNKFIGYKSFDVINADFIKCPLKEAEYNLVYCATAFHWLPLEESYEKVKNILCNNGTIALFWNHPFPNRKDDISNVVNRRIYAKYHPTDKKIIEFTEKDCQSRICELKQYGFKDIQSKLYYTVRTLLSEEYISLLSTYSSHRNLPLDIKIAFENEMKNVIDEIGGKINIYDTMDLYLPRKM